LIQARGEKLKRVGGPKGHIPVPGGIKALKSMKEPESETSVVVWMVWITAGENGRRSAVRTFGGRKLWKVKAKRARTERRMKKFP
jgi:hypothetical protein